MNNHPTELSFIGIESRLSGMLRPCLEQASSSLALDAEFKKIRLVMDDLQGCDDAWLQFGPDAGPEAGLTLDMYIPSTIFGKYSFVDSNFFPEREIWEIQEAPRQDIVFDEDHFRPEFCLQYLHHHLLTARDVARRELIPGRVPSHIAESYQVCWAVTVDGRLEKWGLPGFSMPERRRHFSRLFSQMGVLMPNHWSIFQALWEGGISGQGAVLEAVGGLPRF